MLFVFLFDQYGFKTRHCSANISVLVCNLGNLLYSWRIRRYETLGRWIICLPFYGVNFNLKQQLIIKD